MKLTRNLWVFAALNAVTSVAFFSLLDAAVAAEAWGRTTALAIGYFFAWLVSGALLGRGDSNRDSRGNLGRRYHLVATAIVAGASVWAGAFLSHLDWKDSAGVLAITGLSLVVHWLATRGHTKGIAKEEAFR